MDSVKRTSFVFTMSAFLLFTLSTTALSQTDPLEQLSEEQLVELFDVLNRADTAEQAGRWSEALGLYQEAESIVPLPEYAFRQAFCLEHLDRRVEALAIYRDIAENGGDSDAVGSAQQRIETLAEEPVAVTVESGASGAEVVIDGDAAGMTPVALQLQAGTYRIVISHEGYDSFAEELIVEPITPAILVASLDLSAPSQTVTEGSPLRWWTISLGVGALGAAVVGTWMGAVSIIAENDWNDSKETSSRGDADHFAERAEDSARIANYSFIFAGALAAGTLVSLYFDLTREEETTTAPVAWSPVVSPTFAGGVIEVRF